MEVSERDVHDMLTHLTSVLVGLEILRDHTELSPRQRTVVDHALGSADALKRALLDQIARQIGWGDDGSPPVVERRAHPRWTSPRDPRRARSRHAQG
jgi:hypothetical protein